MVFIRGAWIEPHHTIFPWDTRWNEYFCCPEHFNHFISHMETFDPATGKGEKHDPPMWTTCYCDKTPDKKEISFTEDDFHNHAIIRPAWCPLREG
jgi:hypothetical protein